MIEHKKWNAYSNIWWWAPEYAKHSVITVASQSTKIKEHPMAPLIESDELPLNWTWILK